MDIGAIIAAVGYAYRIGVEVKVWREQRREDRIDKVIMDAIQWVYVHIVQKQKKESPNGKLTAEQAAAANADAVAKAREFADAAGLALDAAALPGRVQGVFSRVKAALRNNGQPDILKGA